MIICGEERKAISTQIKRYAGKVFHRHESDERQMVFENLVVHKTHQFRRRNGHGTENSTNPVRLELDWYFNHHKEASSF